MVAGISLGSWDSRFQQDLEHKGHNIEGMWRASLALAKMSRGKKEKEGPGSVAMLAGPDGCSRG